MAQQLSSALMPLPKAAPRIDRVRGASVVWSASSSVVVHVAACGQARPVYLDYGYVRGCRRNRAADQSRSCYTERQDRRDNKGSPDAHDSSTTTTGAGRVRLLPVGETHRELPF